MVRARSIATADAELLASAVALRWSRPDLTAAVAEHVAGTWVADNRTWVAATGWLVHGRATVGDGREHASDALTELLSRDPALFDDPAADRLRIEVATLAAIQREPAVARQLVEPLGHDRPAEVQADALAVLARCAFEDRPAVVGEAIRRATDAWTAVRGAQAEVAVAALTHLSAAAARRAGHPEAAADHAAEGLARLDDLRPGTSAPHLAAALAAEWITALVEAGRAEEACAACTSTAKHLVSLARPTRQIALLRLTVARALAESSSPGAFEALEQAATDASACDAPDLEGLCLSALGALREQAGRIDAALESMRRGVAAQRRDRARSERFRAALRALPLMPSGTPVPMNAADRLNTPAPPQSVRGRPLRTGEVRADEPHPLSANPWTTGRWTTGATRSNGGVGRAAAIGRAADLLQMDGGRRRRPALGGEPGSGSAAGFPHSASGADRGTALGVETGLGSANDVPHSAGGVGGGAAVGVEPGSGRVADLPRSAGGLGRGTLLGVEPGSGRVADLPRSAGGLGRGTAAGVETGSGAAADLPRMDGGGRRPAAGVENGPGSAGDLPPTDGGGRHGTVIGAETDSGAAADRPQMDGGTGRRPAVGGEAGLGSAADLPRSDARVRGGTAAGVEPGSGAAADLPQMDGGGRRSAVSAEAGPGSAADRPQMDGGGHRRPTVGVEPGPGIAADPPHMVGGARQGTAVGVEMGSGSAADFPHSDGGVGRGTGVGVETGPGAADDLLRVDRERADRPVPRVRTDFAGAGGLDAGETLVDPLFGALGGPKHVDEPDAPPTVREAEEVAPVEVAGARDSESWLATALSELDRAWSRPLPELGRSVDAHGEAPERRGAASSPSPIDGAAAAAGVSSGDDGSGDAFDEQAASPWANWTDDQPEIARGGDPTDSGKGRDDNAHGIAHRAAAPLGTPGRGDRVGSSAVGCVVVVDVVCAGTAIPEGTTLLAGLSERLAERIPTGARMRLDEGESTLSVVMPGQDQPVAAGWMHRTLPGVFHDASASDACALLPVGSALRATVHDTDGPVGAQLLQRLDVAGAVPVTAPLVPIRWGVPIAPGSGGRRRRPEDAGGVVAGAVDTARRPGRHREGPDDGPPPAFGRPMVSRRPRPWPGASAGTLTGAAAGPGFGVGIASPSPATIDGLDGVRRDGAVSGMRRRARDVADGMRRGAGGDGRPGAAGGGSGVGAASAEVPHADTMGAAGGVTGAGVPVAGLAGASTVSADTASTGVAGADVGAGTVGAGTVGAGTVGAGTVGAGTVGAGTVRAGAVDAAVAGAGTAGADSGAAGPEVAGSDAAGSEVAGADAGCAAVAAAAAAGAGPAAAGAGAQSGGAAIGTPEYDAVWEDGWAEGDGEPEGPGGEPRSPAVPAGGQAAAADPEPGPAPAAAEEALSVEGLGLADLLAGALAAYRAI